ncbi:hypothetical protein COB57_01055 [Candidatus Peregrinibacteria bacterium]|nr:MAG: hypothetical protein COB57_01055 [Candidatus Peregrinibacteria bacterium]
MKTMCVTGVSRGIGHALVMDIIDDYIVYGISRRDPDIYHKNFHWIESDVNDIEKIRKSIPEIDIFIGNAGVGYFGKLDNISSLQIKEIIETNLVSNILLSQAFLLDIRKNSGQYIFIGSQSGEVPASLGAVYVASKFGLRGFAESLFLDEKKYGVGVTLIQPGMVHTSFFQNTFFQPADKNCALDPKEVVEYIQKRLQKKEGVYVVHNILPQKFGIIKN